MLVDRERELSELNGHLQSSRPSLLAVVGRRRLGIQHSLYIGLEQVAIHLFTGWAHISLQKPFWPNSLGKYGIIAIQRGKFLVTIAMIVGQRPSNG